MQTVLNEIQCIKLYFHEAQIYIKKVPLNIWIFIMIYLGIYFISLQYKKRINGDIVKQKLAYL